tara:strand:+ start:1801 stop:2361 length:561 start_codon:yes stop_codon:yes gene_type:complete
MQSIINSKKLERLKFKKLRAQSSLLERKSVKKNIEIFINSLDKNSWKSKFFAIYWPLLDEVDLRDLKQNYPLALPKCESNNKLGFYAWNNTSLKEDKEGILAPDNAEPLSYKQISHIFVPCLSIDKKLSRLGYGGGYYDKLRSYEEWRLIPCIGVLTEKCVSKNLLTKADWDIPLNGYITNKKILI